MSRVRARAVGAVVAAALLGGLMALGIYRGLGWTGGTKTVEQVVVNRTPEQPGAAVISAARPLAGLAPLSRRPS